MALDLPVRRTLTLEAARVAMSASEAEARRGGWRVVIAVVDDGGHPILVQRLDGAQISSIDTAVGKARAAVAWKRPTRLLEESVNGGRYAFLSISRGMALLQGMSIWEMLKWGALGLGGLFVLIGLIASSSVAGIHFAILGGFLAFLFCMAISIPPRSPHSYQIHRDALVVFTHRLEAEIDAGLDSVVRLYTDRAAFRAMAESLLDIEHDLARAIAARTSRRPDDFEVRVAANASFGVFRAAVRAAVVDPSGPSMSELISVGMRTVRSCFAALAATDPAR